MGGRPERTQQTAPSLRVPGSTVAVGFCSSTQRLERRRRRSVLLQDVRDGLAERVINSVIRVTHLDRGVSATPLPCRYSHAPPDNPAGCLRLKLPRFREVGAVQVIDDP